MKFSLDNSRTINLHNTELKPIRCPVEAEFPTLNNTERSTLRNHIENHYNQGREIVDQIIDWKLSPSSTRARKHETAFKSVFGISRNVRITPTQWSPNSDQEDAIEKLQEISEQAVRVHGPQEAPLYRGAGYEAPFLLREMLRNSSGPYQLNGIIPVLSNYTRCKSRAISAYSPIIITKENLSPDNVMLASDLLFGVENRQGEFITPEGELRMNGDEVTPISRNEVTVVFEDKDRPGNLRELPIGDVIDKLPHQLDKEHHWAMKRIIRTIGRRQKAIPTDQSVKKTLRNWAASHDNNPNLPNDAQGLLRDRLQI